MGSVRLILPDDSAFDLNAKADLGQISNDFAVVGDNENKLLGETVDGTVGEPTGTTLSIHASMGSVDIERQ